MLAIRAGTTITHSTKTCYRWHCKVGGDCPWKCQLTLSYNVDAMVHKGRVAGLCLLVAASLSFGQSERVFSSPVHRRAPLAYAWAKIKKTTGPAYLLEQGDWHPYRQDEVSLARQTANAFDQFEYSFDQDGGIVPNQNTLYGDSCVPPLSDPAQRYFLGDGFDCGLVYNDIKTVGSAAGKTSSRAGFSWYARQNARFDNLAVFIATTENWTNQLGSANTPGASGRNDYAGVLFSYGPETGSGIASYSDVDLSGAGLGWQLPMDGQGGCLAMAGDYDSFGHTFSVGKAQMMLWGLKSGNPSTSESPECWLDANPTNGTFDAADLMVLDFSGTGICQSVSTLGPCVCFFFDQSGPVVLTPTSLSVGLGAIVTGSSASLGSDDGNVLKLCKAFVPNFASPRLRFDADFLSPYPALSGVELRLKARMSTGGTFKVRGFLADRTGSGFTYGPPNQLLSDTAIGLTFQSYSAQGTGLLNRFVNSDGSMRARVEIQQTGFSAVPVPCSEFESLNVVVSP